MVRSGLLPYVGGSALGMAATTASAFYKHEQFYPACIYLTTGKFNQLVVCNFLVAFSICFGIFVKKLTLGSLRASEVENLMDRLWPTIFDTLLLTTIFRGELTSDFFALFGVLIFVSIFHWIVKDRVDYIATSPIMSFLKYLRLASLVFTLLLFDAAYVYYVYSKVMTEGPSYVLLFGFEYALLLWTIICITLKFVFNVVDIRLENQWHNKAIYVLAAEFMEATQKFLTLICFFITVQAYYGVPLHILRRLIVSYRMFQKRFAEVVNNVRLARNMNQIVADATREELEAADSMCVICRDDMAEGKKLPCGHIFHAGCLRGWLGRSHECPTCRHSLLPHLQPNRRGRRQRVPGQPQPNADQLIIAQQQRQQQMLVMMQRHIEEQQQQLRQQVQPPAAQPQPPAQLAPGDRAAMPPYAEQPIRAPAHPREHRPIRQQPSQPVGQPSPSPGPQPMDAHLGVTSTVDPRRLLGTVSDIQSQVAQLAAQLASLQTVLEEELHRQERSAVEVQEVEHEVEAAVDEIREEAIQRKQEPREDVASTDVQPETEVIPTAQEQPAEETDDHDSGSSPAPDSMAEIRQRRLLRFSSDN